MTTKPIADLSYIPDCPGNIGQWKERHQTAVNAAIMPSGCRRYPVLRAIQAWTIYADTHAEQYESDIGEDHILGPAWASWGLSLRTLLNGELGPGVDAGTLDHIIVENLTRQGYSGLL